MLLIDGVKYQEWTDLKETEDLEPMVSENAKYIFGEKALYIDSKQKLKSLAGIGSIPDAYVISLEGNSPHWHIVEIELSYKDPRGHLVTQLNNFINGMKNSRNEIVTAINQWIKSDNIRALEFKRQSKCEEIHEFLAELISKDPVITIIIEKHEPKLNEAIQIFKEKYDIEVKEFRTFRREGAEAVHAHLFEPLYKPFLPQSKPEKSTSSGDEIEIELDTANCITYHFIPLYSDYDTAFFPNPKIPFIFETNLGDINTNVAGGEITKNKISYIQRNLKSWFEAHPQLRKGDALLITMIEPMKRYRLEIVKP